MPGGPTRAPRRRAPSRPADGPKDWRPDAWPPGRHRPACRTGPPPARAWPPLGRGRPPPGSERCVSGAEALPGSRPNPRSAPRPQSSPDHAGSNPPHALGAGGTGVRSLVAVDKSQAAPRSWESPSVAEVGACGVSPLWPSSCRSRSSAPRWSQPGAPLDVAGDVVVWTRGTGPPVELVALETTSGRERWHRPAKDLGVYADGRHALTVGDDRSIVALDPDSGAQRWRAEVGGGTI